jgi:hypothetical protein
MTHHRLALLCDAVAAAAAVGRPSWAAAPRPANRCGTCEAEHDRSEGVACVVTSSVSRKLRTRNARLAPVLDVTPL